MHAGGRIGDHTTGSFVVELRRNTPITVWATGASTPCISAFKPVFFGKTKPPDGSGIPARHNPGSMHDSEVTSPGGSSAPSPALNSRQPHDSGTSAIASASDCICTGIPVHDSDEQGREYWLERERLHRAVLAGLVDVARLRARRDALEKSWQEEESRIFAEMDGNPDPERLYAFAARAAFEEQEMVKAFSSDRWAEIPGRDYFARYWRKKNATLGAANASGNARPLG
jgi:hypothetical protein